MLQEAPLCKDRTCITNTLGFTVLPPGRADLTLPGDILFSSMGIISSRICSFILCESCQGGFLWGDSFRNNKFCNALFLKVYGNRLVFIIDTNLEQKPNGAKCE